jgi:cytochrome o ubiquinol oxidase subunit 2
VSDVLNQIHPGLQALAGGGMVVMHPAGDVAVQQRDLIIVATVLMLVIIVPVITLTLLFAWKYRQSNTKAVYLPDWHHSAQLELVIWTAPLAIIVVLGAVTWKTTHLLDPYRPIDRLAPHRPLAADVKPLRVEAVALDWKWLFIYPDIGVATVNTLAAPVNVPIDFRITAGSVMNSFSVPALAGQVYAMPGMQTQLHAVINQPGDYQGFSANYSGAGFSGMRFRFQGLSQVGFNQWVAAARAGGDQLGRDAYLKLERPSESDPVHTYAAVDPGLYHAILNRCVDPGKMCADEMARIDARGGLGLANAGDVRTLEYDKAERRGGDASQLPGQSYVAALCAPKPPANPRLALGPSSVTLK